MTTIMNRTEDFLPWLDRGLRPILKGIGGVIRRKSNPYNIALQMEGVPKVECSDFWEEIIAAM